MIMTYLMLFESYISIKLGCLIHGLNIDRKYFSEGQITNLKHSLIFVVSVTEFILFTGLNSPKSYLRANQSCFL